MVEAQEIELNDGTVINGKIISFANGVYTIESEALGQLKIKESKIKTIHLKSSAKNKKDETESQSANSQVKSMQNLMVTDSSIMEMILSLQNDPKFQKILKNPEIMNAVNSGDTKTLMSNPEFMELLNNSTVKEITKNTTQ